MKRPFATLLLCAFAVSAAADGRDRERDHDRAREALRNGDAAPLAEILPAVESRLGARVIEVGLEREDGRLIYELELIAPDGRILEAEVDARTGAIIEVEADDEDHHEDADEDDD
jgi:uncharacterized membrane protein YkoI